MAVFSIFLRCEILMFHDFFLLVLCFHRLLPLCGLDRRVGAGLRGVLCNLLKKGLLLAQPWLPLQQP